MSCILEPDLFLSGNHSLVSCGLIRELVKGNKAHCLNIRREISIQFYKVEGHFNIRRVQSFSKDLTWDFPYLLHKTNWFLQVLAIHSIFKKLYLKLALVIS